MQIRDIVTSKHKSINPQEWKSTIFSHYSLPAFDNAKTISIEVGNTILSNKFLLESNSILFNKLNIKFKRIWNVKNPSPNSICSSEFIPLIVDETQCLQDYLFYFLCSESLTNNLLGCVSGTSNSQQRIRPNDLLDQEIELPTLSVQRHIVDILGTLDEKIENNSKILNELNNLIQLEFEKTILANSSEERLLADVFAFQEGPGIRNWQYVDKGINFINIRCINDGDIDTSSMNKISEQEAYGIYNHFLLNEWDLVMSMSGTLGRYAIVGKEHLPLCLNTSVIRFYPKNDFTYYSYMYAYLTSKDFIASITTLANGSAQQNVGPTHLKKVTIKLPNEEVIKQFHQRVFPLINRMVSLRGDNQKIKELKEYYLKKFFG